MAKNKNKNRKTEAQERFEEADNAGRFAGDDADAKAARAQAVKNIKQDNNSMENEHTGQDENTDAEARRDAAQSHDYKGESQNVNDDTGRPLNEDEIAGARNKAMEGTRQNRDISDSGNNNKTFK